MNKENYLPDWRLSDAACERLAGYGLQPSWSILEYGPGWSTFVIQEAIKPLRHIVIDEPGNGVFLSDLRERNLPIDYDIRPLDDYFIPNFVEGTFDLILVDGPSTVTGRGAAYDAVMSMSHAGTIIVVDDSNRREEAELVLRLKNSGAWMVTVISDTVYRQRQTSFLEPK